MFAILLDSLMCSLFERRELSIGFYDALHCMQAGYMLWPYCLSVCLSVRLSVCLSVTLLTRDTSGPGVQVICCLLCYFTLLTDGKHDKLCCLKVFYSSAVCAVMEALCLCLVRRSFCLSVRPVFRPVPNIFNSLRKNTDRISMKFEGGNDGNYYHEPTKLESIDPDSESGMILTDGQRS